jgi:Phosphopantetheine attachment site
VDNYSLEAADFDWRRSLAEMGCDSLSMMDIQFELERQLAVHDLDLTGPEDFDPLRAPLDQLERHVRSKLQSE